MKIETIAQAKANARVAYEHYSDLLRLQKRLTIEVPEAFAQLEAARAITLRLMAQRGSDDHRKAEVVAIKQQIEAAKSGAPLPTQSEAANRVDTLDIFIAEVAGA